MSADRITVQPYIPYVPMPLPVLVHDRLTESDKVIYGALQSFAWKSNTCWPSVEKLAERAARSERQTQRSLRHLEAEGFIRRTACYAEHTGFQSSNRYTLRYYLHDGKLVDAFDVPPLSDQTDLAPATAGPGAVTPQLQPVHDANQSCDLKQNRTHVAPPSTGIVGPGVPHAAPKIHEPEQIQKETEKDHATCSSSPAPQASNAAAVQTCSTEPEDVRAVLVAYFPNNTSLVTRLVRSYPLDLIRRVIAEAATGYQSGRIINPAGWIRVTLEERKNDPPPPMRYLPNLEQPSDLQASVALPVLPSAQYLPNIPSPQVDPSADPEPRCSNGPDAPCMIADVKTDTLPGSCAEQAENVPPPAELPSRDGESLTHHPEVHQEGVPLLDEVARRQYCLALQALRRLKDPRFPRWSQQQEAALIGFAEQALMKARNGGTLDELESLAVQWRYPHEPPLVH